MSSIDTRRQEKDRNYPRAENSGIYAAPSIASRKYFDYYATPTSTRQNSLPREQAREAQRPRKMHRHSSSLASSLTSSLPSSRGHPSIPPTARGYAGIASDSRASRAPPVQESPASSQLQSARMSNYQAQAFDYYRTPSSSRASGTTVRMQFMASRDVSLKLISPLLRSTLRNLGNICSSRPFYATYASIAATVPFTCGDIRSACQTSWSRMHSMRTGSNWTMEGKPPSELF